MCVNQQHCGGRASGSAEVQQGPPHPQLPCLYLAGRVPCQSVLPCLAELWRCLDSRPGGPATQRVVELFIWMGKTSLSQGAGESTSVWTTNWGSFEEPAC